MVLHMQPVPGCLSGGVPFPEGFGHPQGAGAALEAQRVQQGSSQIMCRQVQEQREVAQHRPRVLQAAWYKTQRGSSDQWARVYFRTIEGRSATGSMS